MAAAAGLPVDDGTYIRAPVTALLDGEPWLPHRIRYDQAPVLARHLSTACFVIIAYLTGQRPGETANLERGCLTRDAETGLVLLHGRHFKGATGDDGSHLPEGKIRDDPWVTVEPVATAVAVAGRLHDAQLLFPNTLLVNGSACASSLGDRVGRARGQSHVGGDITSLVTWINQYCREQGRLDPAARSRQPWPGPGPVALDPGLVHRPQTPRPGRRRDPVRARQCQDDTRLRRQLRIRVPRRARVRAVAGPHRHPRRRLPASRRGRARQRALGLLPNTQPGSPPQHDSPASRPHRQGSSSHAG